MSFANKFYVEWSPLLGKVHRTEHLPALSEAIRAFVTIPAERRLSSTANESLMETLAEAEVLQVIAELSRHKTAGPDGLNNDFLQDISA